MVSVLGMAFVGARRPPTGWSGGAPADGLVRRGARRGFVGRGARRQVVYLVEDNRLRSTISATSLVVVVS